MSVEFEITVRELKDRQDIYDCLVRYCRGLDRRDRELLASAYHADALDDHGFFVGSVQALIDWVFPINERNYQSTQHFIANHSCELDGDTAHTETYFFFTGLSRKAPFYATSTGRYIDRFERRAGRWAIAARLCITETLGDRDDLSALSRFVPGAPNPADPSYQRPLSVDPSRLTR